MTLAIQAVDVNTCEPVQDAFLDIWSSNSTVSSLESPREGDSSSRYWWNRVSTSVSKATPAWVIPMTRRS